MFSLWQKPRERFSIEELKYLSDLLQRHTVITDSNKDAIVETLRSIAELMIWGDQHEPAFFEYFAEHGVFAHIVHILSVSNKSSSCGVTVQLLQTLNIMIQNIKSEKAIFYLFSKEYINNVIAFPFDFSDEELLAYYISFLKVISMKLDTSTITYFLVEKKDGALTFPLYVEAIRFFHHEESMVRIAVRTISLTVYNVKDSRVREFVLSPSAIRYFEDLAIFIRQQSFTLAKLVKNAARNFASVVDVGRVEASIAEIGDLLYYCNDVMNAGIPELSEVMSEHLASIWLFPLLLMSLSQEDDSDSPSPRRISPLCSMYLLSRVFHVITYRPFVEMAIRALVAAASTPSPTGPTDQGEGPEGGPALATPAGQPRGTPQATPLGERQGSDRGEDRGGGAGDSSLGGLWRGLFGEATGLPAGSPGYAATPEEGAREGEGGQGSVGLRGTLSSSAEEAQAGTGTGTGMGTTVVLRQSSSETGTPAPASEPGPQGGPGGVGASGGSAYWTPGSGDHGGGAVPLGQGQCAVNPSASAWDTVIAHLMSDKDRWILAALCILCGLLHNQAVEDESLDELGILPIRKRHRRMLVEALVDEKASEEDLKRLLQPPNASDSSSDSSTSASPLEPLLAAAAAPVGADVAGASATGCAGPSSTSMGGGAAAPGACRVCGGAVGDEGVVARGQGGARAPGAPGMSSFWHDEFQASLTLQPRQGARCSCGGVGPQQLRNGDMYFSPSGRHRKRRRQVIDAVFFLFCRRPPPCPEVLWHAAWLLRQLLPLNAKLGACHAQLLENAYECARADVIVEMLECWSDILPAVMDHDWRACTKALESANLNNDSALVLLPSLNPLIADGDASSAAFGERMRSVVKVFVLLHRMRCLLLGLAVPEALNIGEPGPLAADARLWRRGLTLQQPQEGEEVSFAVGDALPCRVAFERGKEKKVLLLVASSGPFGWILLAESGAGGDAPKRKTGDPALSGGPGVGQPGVPNGPSGEGAEDESGMLTATIRVVAPLAGSQPNCDPKHKRWLHLRIRSPQHPPTDSGTLASRSPLGSRAQGKRLADGRWTLAFTDEQQCRRAQLAVMEEIYIQGNAVRTMLEPTLGPLPAFRLHRDRPL